MLGNRRGGTWKSQIEKEGKPVQRCVVELMWETEARAQQRSRVELCRMHLRDALLRMGEGRIYSSAPCLCWSKDCPKGCYLHLISSFVLVPEWPLDQIPRAESRRCVAQLKQGAIRIDLRAGGLLQQ